MDKTKATVDFGAGRVSAPRGVTRRQALLSGAAAGAAVAAGPALAEAPFGGVVRPTGYRFKLGAFEVSTVFDGIFQLDGPHPIFGEDQSADDVAALMRENFLPETRMEIGFTPVLVNTGSQLILIDTGNGDERADSVGGLAAAMAGLGYSPEQVDVVVITHFHPDHIGGMLRGGQPAFPNARFVTSAEEFDFWRANSEMRGDGFASLLKTRVFDFSEKFSFIKDGEDVATGMTAISAHGHTPGHTTVHLESEGQRLVIISDACNHYVASMQRPDWHVRFDMDKEGAAAARKKLLGMIAADRVPFTGYHMPFPAVGFVQEQGAGFEYIAASYQLSL